MTTSTPASIFGFRTASRGTRSNRFGLKAGSNGRARFGNSEVAVKTRATSHAARWGHLALPASRADLSPLAPRSSPDRRKTAPAFTLIELILVMALLAIGATLVAPRMASFFRGRSLDLEGQRILALAHLGQSRAVSEGMPIILWFDTKAGTYGLNIQEGYIDTDDRASVFTIDQSLTLEAPNAGTPPVSEQQDEKLGLPDGMPIIRFNPDGFPDVISQPKIVIRQGDEGALQLVPTANGFSYEIQPYNATPAHY